MPPWLKEQLRALRPSAANPYFYLRAKHDPREDVQSFIKKQPPGSWTMGLLQLPRKDSAIHDHYCKSHLCILIGYGPERRVEFRAIKIQYLVGKGISSIAALEQDMIAAGLDLVAGGYVNYVSRTLSNYLASNSMEYLLDERDLLDEEDDPKPPSAINGINQAGGNYHLG